jgi:hypothetical protein
LGVDAINTNLAANYSTTAQMNSAISVSRDQILQTVTADYATKAELIEVSTDTLEDAQDYADGIGSTAAADATSKANAAADDAKGYTDRVLISYSTTEQMNSAIAQTAASITQTVTNTRTEMIQYADGIGATAATDATTKANAAKQAAISTAASDATSKADAAQAAAIAAASADAAQKAADTLSAANEYTENRLISYSTTSQMTSAIEQTAESITQTVAATYTTKAEYEQFQIGARNLILNSLDLVGDTHFFYSWALTDSGVMLTDNGKIQRIY